MPCAGSGGERRADSGYCCLRTPYPKSVHTSIVRTTLWLARSFVLRRNIEYGDFECSIWSSSGNGNPNDALPINNGEYRPATARRVVYSRVYTYSPWWFSQGCTKQTVHIVVSVGRVSCGKTADCRSARIVILLVRFSGLIAVHNGTILCIMIGLCGFTTIGYLVPWSSAS